MITPNSMVFGIPTSICFEDPPWARLALGTREND